MTRKIQPVQVHVSSVLDANVDEVWKLVRGFNAMPQWNPGVVASRIEEDRDPDSVGCVRNFQLRDGSTVRERLLSLCDTRHHFAYSMLDSELGLLDYVAEFSLRPVTDGDRTYVTWSANFRTRPGQETEKADLVANGVFQNAFDALKKRFGKGAS